MGSGEIFEKSPEVDKKAWADIVGRFGATSIKKDPVTGKETEVMPDFPTVDVAEYKAFRADLLKEQEFSENLVKKNNTLRIVAISGLSVAGAILAIVLIVKLFGGSSNKKSYDRED